MNTVQAVKRDLKTSDVDELHAHGAARFVDDLPLPPDALHAAVFCSPAAHAAVVELNAGDALAIEGVTGVLTAADIPGRNQIGVVIEDEPLLADSEVHYRGQPIAMVLAADPETARRGMRAMRLRLEPLPAVLEPLDAKVLGQLFAQPRTFACGDVEAAIRRAARQTGLLPERIQEHSLLNEGDRFHYCMLAIRCRARDWQCVTTKLSRVAAHALGIGQERVRAESANTTHVANVSPSAASVTADLNGKALLMACSALHRRLLLKAAEQLAVKAVDLTLEEERVLHSDKIPDCRSAPEVDVELLPQAVEPAGLLESRAVGEPPFIYGIGAYSALLQALVAFQPDRAFTLDAPLTPERILLALYNPNESCARSFSSGEIQTPHS